MTTRSLALAAALVATAAAFAALPLAACGGTRRHASSAQTGTITAAQYAQRADHIFVRDARQQSALGEGLLNADIVTSAHLAKAAAYLDKIVAITTTEARSLAALPRTKNGMRQRKAFVATLRKVLADERVAAKAAHNGNLAGFRSAFNRFILHGHPTGPDYRTVVRSLNALAQVFALDLSSKRSTIYP